MIRVVLLLAMLAGCSGGTVVDVTPVPDDYTDWYRVETFGPVPGHGDSYRIIYANDIARERGEIVGFYDEGTILVKEVYHRNGDQPGELRYIGVMRTLGSAPDGAELHKTARTNGWLFTYLADDIGSDEEYRSSCWDECHVAAPIDGTFLDYAE